MSGDHEAPRVDRPGRGILLMMGAVLCFTGIDTCAKLLVNRHGLPPMEAVFFRYLGHFLLVAAIYLPMEGRTLLHANRPVLQVVRAGTLAASTLLNFSALKHLPLAVTSAIFFAAPLIVTVLGVFVLAEKVGPRRIAAILIGFVGVLIVVRPGLGALHPAWMLSVGATCCAACYMVMTRVLAGVDSTETSQFYAGMIPVIVIAPLAASVWIMPHGAEAIALCAVIGLFGWLGHQMLVIGHRMAEASTLAPFQYTQIVWMTLSGWVIFGNLPDALVFLGAGIVVASGLYLWIRERQLAAERQAVAAE